MKSSDLIPLADGVFQLEKGHGEWRPIRCETVVIQFAGSKTEKPAKRCENDEKVL